MSGHVDLRCLGDDAPPAGGARRQALLAHVAVCEECRAALAATEPARLFALLGADPVPEAVLQRVSLGVARALDAEGRRSSGGRLIGPLAVAASLVLAMMLSSYLGPRDTRQSGLAASRSAGASESAAPGAVFEVLQSPGTAEVVRMDLGGAELVMIFDKALDL